LASFAKDFWLPVIETINDKIMALNTFRGNGTASSASARSKLEPFLVIRFIYVIFLEKGKSVPLQARGAQRVPGS